MNRDSLRQLLGESESQLHRGEQRLADQRERIDALKRRGENTAAARALLRRLEGRQARHTADRNRLYAALAAAARAAPPARPISGTPRAAPATPPR